MMRAMLRGRGALVGLSLLAVVAALLPVFTGTAEAVSTTFVINEIDYDQPGLDTGEFIELKNVSDGPIDTAGWSVDFVNGSGGLANLYNGSPVALPSVVVPAGGYFVICANAANTPNCDFDTTPDTELIQPGPPDAIGLRNGTTLVDTVSYEGNTGAPYTEGSGFGLVDDPANPGEGISRCADGVDTDQNNVDFLGGRPITPGAANNCPSGPTPRALKETAQLELAALLPTGDAHDDERIEDAIDAIGESLDPEAWVDDSTLDKNDGEEVFEEEREAVEELEGVDSVDVSAVIDLILQADEQLALQQVNAAIVGGGDPAAIAAAQANLADAAAHAAAGEFSAAVADYEQAWQNACRAIGAGGDDDGDDDDGGGDDGGGDDDD